MPEIAPAGSVAADRIYKGVLNVTPAASARETLLPKGPVALNDIWKPGGAVAVITPVKLLPDTVNCWTLGLAEAVPTQAEMVPVAGVIVIVGAMEFTVMVNVIGVPVQPLPLAIKLPNESGNAPTGIVFNTVFEAVLITETVLER